eukprot:6206185-Pleurochrysis_carterae.AAC.6
MSWLRRSPASRFRRRLTARGARHRRQGRARSRGLARTPQTGQLPHDAFISAAKVAELQPCCSALKDGLKTPESNVTVVLGDRMRCASD